MYYDPAIDTMRPQPSQFPLTYFPRGRQSIKPLLIDPQAVNGLPQALVFSGNIHEPPHLDPYSGGYAGRYCWLRVFPVYALSPAFDPSTY